MSDDNDFNVNDLLWTAVAIWVLPCALFCAYCGGTDADAAPEPPERTTFDSKAEQP